MVCVCVCLCDITTANNDNYEKLYGRWGTTIHSNRSNDERFHGEPVVNVIHHWVGVFFKHHYIEWIAFVPSARVSFGGSTW